ncbi:hypothetical protein ACET3Z_005046 [Daucus carota]
MKVLITIAWENGISLGMLHEDREWGAWLRAPPRRSAGLAKSKWLRDDGDDEWFSKVGRSNRSVKSGKVVRETSNDDNNQERNFRGKDEAVIFQNSNNMELSAKDLKHSGPGEDELNGLTILERKRRRENSSSHGGFIQENSSHVKVYNNLELYNTEATLSEMDCAASSQTDSAKLAQQASHP